MDNGHMICRLNVFKALLVEPLKNRYKIREISENILIYLHDSLLCSYLRMSRSV